MNIDYVKFLVIATHQNKSQKKQKSIPKVVFDVNVVRNESLLNVEVNCLCKQVSRQRDPDLSHVGVTMNTKYYINIVIIYYNFYSHCASLVKYNYDGISMNN